MTVRKNRSTRPRPRGMPGVEKIEPHLQVGADLFHVVRGEVGAVVRVESFRDAADAPVRFWLAPDGLPQGQAGVLAVWRLEAEE